MPAILRFFVVFVLIVLAGLWGVEATDAAPTRTSASRKATASKKAAAAKKTAPKKAAAKTSVAAPAWSLHKLGEGAPKVLIIGGIQGDEPGGFSAASLLTTHYTINSGAVWVVPNLGFGSIIERSRGVYGDMNRKFGQLDKDDPDYATVRKIQELIRTPGLHLVLNLHDGSGFYRPTRISDQENPQRWGQCVIIDQSAMEHASGDLEEVGQSVLREVNRTLLTPDHVYYLKNTLTNEGNPSMEKALTWYAVRNNVPAFGVEASKALATDVRAYYHLQVIEAFMKEAGVTFTRHFPLSQRGVAGALQTDVNIRFVDGRMFLPLENLRSRILGTLPLPKEAVRNYVVSKPILAVSSTDAEVRVHYGNRVITRVRPEWVTVDTSLAALPFTIDGAARSVPFGSVVDVQKSFMVNATSGVRINAIGVTRGADESNISLSRTDFQERYSLDPHGYLFRVEAYKGKDFMGMILVRFAGAPKLDVDVQPAVAGRETKFGK